MQQQRTSDAKNLTENSGEISVRKFAEAKVWTSGTFCWSLASSQMLFCDLQTLLS